MVSEKGIETNPKKIEAIINWPKSQTITQMRSLGFCNYYRKFIHKYAQIVKPLHKQISGEQAKSKQNRIVWTEECEEPIIVNPLKYTLMLQKWDWELFSIKSKKTSHQESSHSLAGVFPIWKNITTLLNWNS